MSVTHAASDFFTESCAQDKLERVFILRSRVLSQQDVNFPQSIPKVPGLLSHGPCVSSVLRELLTWGVAAHEIDPYPIAGSALMSFPLAF